MIKQNVISWWVWACWAAKYALELTKAGFHVDGINRSEGHLQYALDHGYIASGKTHDFEDLVSRPTISSLACTPPPCIEWFSTYGHLLKPGCIFTDVSGVKTGLVEPVQATVPGRGGVHCQPPHGRPGDFQRGARRRGELCPGQLHHHPHGKEHPGGHPVGKGAGRGAGLQAHLHPDRAGARQDDRLCQPAVPRHRREPDVRQRQLLAVRVHRRLLP